MKTSKYEASIKVLGKVYKSTGDSVFEAIENLKPIGKCAGMSIIVISKGDTKREKVLTSLQTYRLFSMSPTMRNVAIKNVSLFFDNL